MTAITHAVLAREIWRTNRATHNFARAITLIAAGCALLTLSAKAQIPFYPVPFTMQTFVVLVIGMTFGWRLGGATIALYLMQGALGLPVFAAGGGLVYFTGPTGGFLLAFLPAAIAVGMLAERGFDRAFATTLVAMLIGAGIIFLGGLSWLALQIGLGWEKAIALGLTPFAISELVKILLAALALPGAWKLTRNLKR